MWLHFIRKDNCFMRKIQALIFWSYTIRNTYLISHIDGLVTSPGCVIVFPKAYLKHIFPRLRSTQYSLEVWHKKNGRIPERKSSFPIMAFRGDKLAVKLSGCLFLMFGSTISSPNGPFPQLKTIIIFWIKMWPWGPAFFEVHDLLGPWAIHPRGWWCLYWTVEERFMDVMPWQTGWLELLFFSKKNCTKPLLGCELRSDLGDLLPY